LVLIKTNVLAFYYCFTDLLLLLSVHLRFGSYALALLFISVFSIHFSVFDTPFIFYRDIAAN